MSTTPHLPDFTGQFGLSKISGFIGVVVNILQAIVGDGSKYTHAYIVVGDQVIEAMPGGARITPLSYYLTGARATTTVISNLDLSLSERLDIADIAVSLVGTPYSFLDYAALALRHWGFQPRWLLRYLASTKHMICSQLVDEVYRRAGIHLFDDGRPAQYVTPGALADYLIRNRSVAWPSPRSLPS